MAEVLGIAASAVSLAAFSGQLAQSAAFLCTVFKDIQNAPTDINRLSNELRIVSSILTNLQQSTTTSSSHLEQALQHSNNVINDLSNMVKSLDQSGVTTKREKVWNTVKAVLKRSELSNHLSALERCKTMLLQCCSAETITTQTRHSDTLEKVQDSLGRLSIQQSDHTTSIVQNVAVVESMKSSLSLFGDSSMIVQTAVQDLTSLSSGTAQTASRIEQAVGTLNESMTMLGRTVSKAQAVIETIHSTTSALMVATNQPSNSASSNRSEQIESTSRIIKDVIFRREPVLPDAWGHDMKRTISETLRRNLKEMDRYPGEYAQDPASNSTHDSQRRRNQSSSWRLESSTAHERILTRNTIFGTLSTHSWKTSRAKSRTCDDDGDLRKETTVTTVRFSPAPWLSSKAFIFTFNALKLHGTTWKPPPPTWGLRTVNIIPEDSAICRALQSLDIDSVRTLFDEGRASPFDVDVGGRNLLGFVSLGARAIERGHTADTDLLELAKDRIGTLCELVDLLLGFGLDAGEMDTGFNPLMILAISWFENRRDIREHFNDELVFLLGKLASQARSDPFSQCEAIILVDNWGQYITHQFPGAHAFYPLTFQVLQALMRQEHWPISWDPSQLILTVSLGLESIARYSIEPSPSCFVSLWVDDTCESVEAVLQAKVKFLGLLLTNEAWNNNDYYIRNAIYETILSGGCVFALLSGAEQDFYPPSTGETETHRNKGISVTDGSMKLDALRLYMVEALTMLLESPGCRKYIHQYAKGQSCYELNAITARCRAKNTDFRAVQAWLEALFLSCTRVRAGKEDTMTGPIPPTNPETQVGSVSGDWGGENDSEASSTNGAECNDLGSGVESGWDEEEWEGGFWMADTVEKEYCEGSEFDDYLNPGLDYRYWFWKYDRVRGLDPRPKVSEVVSPGGTMGFLQGALSVTRDALAFVV